jgi:transposase-like protein
MAALRTDHYSLCGPPVFAIFLSYRDVEELVTERGLRVDHTTIAVGTTVCSGIQQTVPLGTEAANGSWRVGETYIRVAGT